VATVAAARDTDIIPVSTRRELILRRVFVSGLNSLAFFNAWERLAV
jgi:hypothetical protein